MSTKFKKEIKYTEIKPNCLFEDKWCKLQNGELEIKTYYFPIGKSKKIEVSSIISIYYAVQDMKSQCFKVKGWGMSFSPCWWACDLRRNWHGNDGLTYYNVIVDVGEGLMKGFTVVEMDAFLNAIRPLLSPDALIQNTFPF